MSQGFEFSEIKRLMSNLLMVGKVTEVSGARAKVLIDGELESDFIPVVSRRSHKTKVFSELEVGEQVLVLSPGELNSGFIVGSLYLKEETPSDKNSISFSDGTSVKYDKGSKTLSVDGAENIAVSGGKTLNIEVSGEAQIQAKAVKIESASSVEFSAKTVDVASSSALVGTGKVVTTSCICAFTGTPHPMGDPSLNIKPGV